MAIYINKSTRVLVQGITGRQGVFHTSQMLAYGTRLIGGVSPGKRGQTAEGRPVYDTVFDAMDVEQSDASICLVYTSPSPRD